MEQEGLFGSSVSESAGCPPGVCTCGLAKAQSSDVLAIPDLLPKDAKSILREMRNLSSAEEFDALRDRLYAKHIVVSVLKTGEVQVQSIRDSKYLCDKFSRNVTTVLSKKLTSIDELLPEILSAEIRFIVYAIRRIGSLADFNKFRSILHKKRIMITVGGKWQVNISHSGEDMSVEVANEMANALSERIKNIDGLLVKILDDTGLFRPKEHFQRGLFEDME